MDGGRTLNNRIRCSGWQVQRPVELQFEETWMSFDLIGVAFICFGEQRGWSLSIQWAQKEVEGGGSWSVADGGRPTTRRLQSSMPLSPNQLFFPLLVMFKKKGLQQKSATHNDTKRGRHCRQSWLGLCSLNGLFGPGWTFNCIWQSPTFGFCISSWIFFWGPWPISLRHTTYVR